ncbi:hypothetical protein BDQ12DRAFT_682678 [Crucibulum laeve]|uniref:Uncharacterized protein n=1 Tax=Crucibulum laeve TaxID=68775 RepID=A0A5C3M0E6_9AGAR|nr:hypothetical protein BDQ12DRAFT_682678 [Crucibulum laeve]
MAVLEPWYLLRRTSSRLCYQSLALFLAPSCPGFSLSFWLVGQRAYIHFIGPVVDASQDGHTVACFIFVHLPLCFSVLLDNDSESSHSVESHRVVSMGISTSSSCV